MKNVLKCLFKILTGFVALAVPAVILYYFAFYVTCAIVGSVLVFGLWVIGDAIYRSVKGDWS